jgi:hypothetical protein
MDFNDAILLPLTNAILPLLQTLIKGADTFKADNGKATNNRSSYDFFCNENGRRNKRKPLYVIETLPAAGTAFS